MARLASKTGNDAKIPLINLFVQAKRFSLLHVGYCAGSRD
jgi:hypothetical protein